uniref:Pco135291a n=1 Tax=Arundo donax TaxID=35708 RepID=A0A0A9GK61_ARUDO
MSLHFHSSLVHGSYSLGYQSVPCMLLQKYQLHAQCCPSLALLCDVGPHSPFCASL